MSIEIRSGCRQITYAELEEELPLALLQPPCKASNRAVLCMLHAKARHARASIVLQPCCCNLRAEPCKNRSSTPFPCLVKLFLRSTHSLCNSLTDLDQTLVFRIVAKITNHTQIIMRARGLPPLGHLCNDQAETPAHQVAEEVMCHDSSSFPRQAGIHALIIYTAVSTDKYFDHSISGIRGVAASRCASISPGSRAAQSKADESWRAHQRGGGRMKR